MKVTIKAYEFMNNLYLTKEEADQDSIGWTHKESVKTIFVSIDENDLNYAQSKDITENKVEFLDSLNLQVFDTFEDAEENTIEWNELD